MWFGLSLALAVKIQADDRDRPWVEQGLAAVEACTGRASQIATVEVRRDLTRARVRALGERDGDRVVVRIPAWQTERRILAGLALAHYADHEPMVGWGLARVLEACMLEEIGVRPDRRWGPALAAITETRSLDASLDPDHPVTTEEDFEKREELRTAVRAWFTAAAAVVPREELLTVPPEGWEPVVALTDATEHGERFRQVFQDAEAGWEALVDLDGDGRFALLEDVTDTSEMVDRGPEGVIDGANDFESRFRTRIKDETNPMVLFREVDRVDGALSWCAGTEGRWSDTVLLEIRDPRNDDPLVRWRPDVDGRIEKISLPASDDPVPDLLIGMASAYVPGKDGLSVGRRALMVDCVAELYPRSFRRHHVDADDLSVRLQDWTPSGTAADLGAGQGRAARTLGAVAQLVGPERARQAEDWSIIEAALGSEAGGGAVLKALAGDGAVQAEAFSDADGDGVVHVLEEVRGTDPAVRDTDGDGWWDGVDRSRIPTGAWPVPEDGTAICASRRGEDDTAWFWLSGSTRSGTRPAPEAYLHTSENKRYFADQVDPDLLEHPGGDWVAPEGDALVDNRYCGWTPWATVRLKDRRAKGAIGAVAGLVEALRDVETWMNTEYGRPSVRMEVNIDKGETVAVHGEAYPRIRLDSDQLWFHHKVGRLEALAIQLVAMHRLALSEHVQLHNKAAAAAFFQHLRGRKRGRPILDTWPAEVRTYRKHAKRCETGWKGLMDGSCDPWVEPLFDTFERP